MYNAEEKFFIDAMRLFPRAAQIKNAGKPLPKPGIVIIPVPVRIKDKSIYRKEPIMAKEIKIPEAAFTALEKIKAACEKDPALIAKLSSIKTMDEAKAFLADYLEGTSLSDLLLAIEALHPDEGELTDEALDKASGGVFVSGWKKHSKNNTSAAASDAATAKLLEIFTGPGGIGPSWTWEK